MGNDLIKSEKHQDIKSTMIEDDSFLWNPEAKETLNNALIFKSKEGNYSIAAIDDMDTGFVIYRGEPTTMHVSLYDGETFDEWSTKILSRIDNTSDYLLDLYPRYADNSVSSSQLARKLRMNAFNIDGGCALYLTASKFNHSCMYNAGESVDQESYKMCIFALRNIQEGEEITIPYFGSLVIDNIEKRREMLSKLDMQCSCIACLGYNNPQPTDNIVTMMIDSGDPSKNIRINNCVWCGKKGKLKTCSKCKITKYCSSKCHKKHWTIRHKKQCKIWSQRK